MNEKNEYSLSNEPRVLRDRLVLVKSSHDKENPYCMIRRDSLQNNRLSYEARGMLAFLLSQKEGKKIKPKDLIVEGICGRDKVYSILSELEIAKHLKRPEKYQDDKGHWRWKGDWEIYEQPYTAKPNTVEPNTENTEIKDQNTKDENTKEYPASDDAHIENSQKESIPCNQEVTLDSSNQNGKEEPIPKPKSAYIQLVEQVSIHFFHTEPQNVNGAKIGGRIGKIAGWLNGTSAPAGMSRINHPAKPGHIQMFAQWWDKNKKRDGKPLTRPKDAVTFIESWREWATSLQSKPILPDLPKPVINDPSIPDWGPTTFAWYLQDNPLIQHQGIKQT